MAEEFKIKLGVELDTDSLQGEINEASRKAKPIELDINLGDVSKDIKEIKNQLGSLSKKGGISLNTESLETSLKNVSSLIDNIKVSIGRIDSKKGVTSLVTTVNKISKSLEKVSNQFDGLNKSLSALSGKDLNLNLNLKLGNSNPVTRNANYGQEVKKTVIPELERQISAYEDYLQDYYKKTFSNWDKRNNAVSTLIKGTNLNINGKHQFQLLSEMVDDTNLEKQISAYRDYIKLIQESAKLQKVDVSGITSGFSETADKIVQNAIDIKTGTKEAEESIGGLKKILGTGINAEALTAQLDPIIQKLEEVRVSIENLSKTTAFDGLTQSFKELSSTLTKLLDNYTLVKKNLESIGDGLGGSSNAVDVSGISTAMDKIEQESDSSTAAVVQNEKKKQEAYKATVDAVVYHAGVISKLNKSETYGKQLGHDGTGFLGTGHYFVDASHKHELDGNSHYNSKPYTSVDLSYYKNLFKVNTFDTGVQLHQFLRDITKYANSKIKNETHDLGSLFLDFKNIFGDVMDMQGFISKLNELKLFAENSNYKGYDRLEDYRDSISTQFMKSLGYEGVDTRGTGLADTRYGTVIYDLKEESILQANITDELQKQGQMLEKINYEKGQVFDTNIDNDIQNLNEKQSKLREINDEYKKSFDTTNLDKSEINLANAENRLSEVNKIIEECQSAMIDIDNETRKYAKEMKSLGLELSDEEIEEQKKRSSEEYADRIDELSKEKAELQSKIPILEEAYSKETQLANEAYEQARQIVEQRHLEAQQAQETANDVIQAEERKQQAIRETAEESKKSVDKLGDTDIKDPSLSKAADKINKKLSGSDIGFSKYDNEIDSVTTKFNKLENQSEQLTSDMSALNTAFGDIKAASAVGDIEKLVSANKEYETVLTRVKNQLDINTRAEKEAAQQAKQEAAAIAKAEKEAATIANRQQKESDAADLKETQNELKKLKDLSYQIGQLDFKIVKSDYNDEINQVKEFERQLELLKKRFNETVNSFDGQDIDIDSEITEEFVKARNKIAEFEAKLADMKISQSITDDFEKLKSIAKEISSIKIDILKSDDTNDVNRLITKLNELENEYDELYSTVNGNLSKREKIQLDNLVKQGDQKVLKEFNNELNEFVKLQNQIENKKFELGKLELLGGHKNEITELNRQIEELESSYNRLMGKFWDKSVAFGDVPIDVMSGLENGIAQATENAENRIKQFKAHLEDLRAESAKKIELDIATDLPNRISKIKTSVSGLSGVSDELQKSLKAIDIAFENVNTAKESGDNKKLIQSYKQLIATLEAVERKYEEFRTAEQNANKAAALQQKKQGLSLDMDNWLKDNSAAAKKFGSTIKELKSQLKSCDDDIDFNNIKREFQNVQKEAKSLGLTTKSLGDTIKTQFQKYSAYLSVAEVFMYVEQGLRDMFEQVKLIDSAMTELKKVTDETESSYNKFLSNAASRAKEIGTTIDGLVASTADFARLGYGFEDAQGLAEVANIYAVVGDEIEGVEGATESLISTMAAFKEDFVGLSNTDSAMRIVDIFNELGNNFAISSGGLGEAFERSASSLAAANNSIHESAALITAANTVVQDPSTVGKWLADIKSGYIG